MSIYPEQLADEVIETDFLIVGGGISGCMAAVSARRKNDIDVVIMEKANVNTSGQVFGVDHQPVQHPAVIGKPVAESSIKNAMMRCKGLKSAKIQLITINDSLKALSIMTDLGVKLSEDDNTFKMMQLAHPMRPIQGPDGKVVGDTIYYRGSDLKTRLAIAAKKSGARIINRTMLTGLVTKDGAVVGATGVNIRTGRYLVIKAKAVLVATGQAHRLYPYPLAPFPNSLFLNHNFDGNCGEGISAAYRAGVRISNMEYVTIFPVSGGKGLGTPFYSQIRNSKNELLREKYKNIGAGSPFLSSIEESKVDAKKKHLQMFTLPFAPPMPIDDLDKDVFFADSRMFDEQEIRFMNFGAAAELPHVLKINELRGDPRKSPSVEMRPQIVGLVGSGGICENEMAETRIKSVYDWRYEC